MKYIIMITAFFSFIMISIANGQTYTYNSEGFESSTWITPALSYTVSTGTWTTSSTLVSGTTTSPNNTYGGTRCLSIPSGQYVTSPTLTDGAATLTFYARSSSSSARLITIYTSTDGATFNSIATANSAASSLSYALITVSINSANVKNVRISFPATGSGAIDDVNISGMSGTQYYNSVGSDVTNLNNWWSNTDGATGTHPSGFTTAGQTFNISHAGALMNASWSVTNLVLAATNTLSINGNTLTLNGSISGTGTLSGSASSSLIISGSGGTLNFTPGAQILKSLTLNTNASGTLGTSLEITGGSSFGTVTISTGATLASNNNLTLKSSSGGTARVGQSGGTITGNVTVERYIPANTRRAWRLLSIPVNTSQTIHTSWQEGQSNGIIGSNNLGTNISSSRSTWTTDGFDFNSASDGLLTWSPTLNNNAGNWVGVTSTNNQLATDNGYMLYIRGDRNCTNQNNTITSTVLRMNGTLKTGNYPATPIPVPASQYALIGNPYVSQIDFRSVSKSTGIDNTFYVWDPKLVGSNGLGAYQTFSSNGTNYLISPGGGSYAVGNGGITNTIEAGQAFFVHATSAGTVSFTEASKTTGNNNVFLPSDTQESIAVNLYGANATTPELLDGTLVLYSSSASDSVTADDAGKLPNFGFNLSVRRDGRDLAIEKRHIINVSDTINLNMSGLIQQLYQLEVITSNLDHPALFGYLVDNYTHTTTALNLNGSTTVSFSSNTDSASFSPLRFRIIFTPVATLPLTFLHVACESVRNYNIIKWQTSTDSRTERFEIERSSDGILFQRQAILQAVSGLSQYHWQDSHPLEGNNMYRVKAYSSSGQMVMSQIVKTNFRFVNKKISAYLPFPGSEKVIIKLMMPLKHCMINLYNALGELIMTSAYDSISNDVFKLPVVGLSRGMYHISVQSDSGTVATTIIL